MHQRQSYAHLISSFIAVIADALAIFFGLQLALWLRFSGPFASVEITQGIPLAIPPADHLFDLKILAVVVFVLVFRQLGLYQRPHRGRLEDKIPRILRAILIGFVLYLAAEAALRMDPEFSRLALALGVVTVPVLVLLERWIIFRIELHRARHAEVVNHVLIIGTDPTALRLKKAVEGDPFLRSRVSGFLKIEEGGTWPEAIPEPLRLGYAREIESLLDASKIDHIVLSDIGIDREQLLSLVLLCEQRYLQFYLVPDLFRILTSDVEMQQIAGIPVMGMGQWPLDKIGARILKRGFDVGFSVFALVLTSPVVLLAALIIKVTSPGPVFFLQERCGEKGRRFNIFKLRTMNVDAEETGPGWTTPDDPRRTRVGVFLRKWNIDELPQFANVLLGHMSVVGPRPERPVYVEQFKDEIERYMRRHVYKPGITGWAQVHGLRGDTSIAERITYDLFYLEHWSLGLDLKIIIKTLASRENAY
ncbi:MAG: exopolysaccharide biosynthesis polyprenyl glycosylphosphotransferase [Verrucomicrobia bacterium]|nr:exopolysaccharide biosynthesis polyprenyl glycosylphosphotransferase [Verrucomicrobiota bacterium]MCH8511229.1 exopolysaccharide biosynthesis polyprenyl glycosylphosphotransferase [Kiritimatiellia bacterium]